MASNEVEVLDPTATVENLPETASDSTLNRRNFMAALGAVGAAAAGIGLLSLGHEAEAQQASQGGYQQADILNFLLNIKYLKGTFYAWITTGADLPTPLLNDSGIVYSIPGETSNNLGYSYHAGTFNLLTSTTGPITKQISDMLSEMYYDELQQLTDLSNQIIQLGSTPISRPVLNIQGNQQTTSQGIGLIFTPATSVTITFSITQNLVMGIARLLEDLSTTAFAYAAQYLSGSSLALATQILASDSFHSGAIRLACIQLGIPYLPTQHSGPGYNSSNTLSSANFAGSLVAGSNVVYGIPTNSVMTSNTFPAVGQVVTGTGIPLNSVVTAYTATNGVTQVTAAGALIKGSNNISLINLSSSALGQPADTSTDLTGLGIVGTTIGSTTYYGQPVTGTNLPVGAFITGVSSPTSSTPGVITIGQYSGSGTVIPAAASATTTVSISQGIITQSSPVITNLSTITGILPGQLVTWQTALTGAQTSLGTFPNNAVVYSVNSTLGTITIGTAASFVQNATTLNALTSSLMSFTGSISGSSLSTISVTTSTSGLFQGQPISGGTIPASTTITGVGSNSVSLSQPATGPVTSATFTSGTSNSFTVNTTETLTIGTGSVTLSNNATISALTNYITVNTADAYDVQPVDLGSAAAAAAGPTALPGTTPSVYQGFFNTAPTGGTGTTPAGFAFARSFSQVLQILFNKSTSLTSQATSGSFFPSGVGGTINGV